jgi:hypothetical protein
VNGNLPPNAMYVAPNVKTSPTAVGSTGYLHFVPPSLHGTANHLL